MLTLVNASKENMQRELVSNLYKEELYDELLYESDEVGLKRKVFLKNLILYAYLSNSNGWFFFQKCTEELAALKQAKKIIQLTELMVDWKQQQSNSL